jgi:hypothetical protein
VEFENEGDPCAQVSSNGKEVLTFVPHVRKKGISFLFLKMRSGFYVCNMKGVFLIKRGHVLLIKSNLG